MACHWHKPDQSLAKCCMLLFYGHLACGAQAGAKRFLGLNFRREKRVQFFCGYLGWPWGWLTVFTCRLGVVSQLPNWREQQLINLQQLVEIPVVDQRCPHQTAILTSQPTYLWSQKRPIWPLAQNPISSSKTLRNMVGPMMSAKRTLFFFFQCSRTLEFSISFTLIILVKGHATWICGSGDTLLVSCWTARATRKQDWPTPVDLARGKLAGLCWLSSSFIFSRQLITGQTGSLFARTTSVPKSFANIPPKYWALSCSVKLVYSQRISWATVLSPNIGNFWRGMQQVSPYATSMEAPFVGLPAFCGTFIFGCKTVVIDS